MSSEMGYVGRRDNTITAGEGYGIEVVGDRPYRVLVGRGLMGHIPPLVAGSRRVAVMYSRPLKDTAERVADELISAGCEVLPLEVPDAEAGKTIEVAARCWDALGTARFTRTDAIVGVGGGAVTDLAGYVAASWLRGVRVAHYPTSLLGMVDAAVGGKTGVNTKAGKNLVGAFHPPAGVVCDVDTLATLPTEELTSGMAEVVKAGFIADPVILDMIENDLTGACDPRSETLSELVIRAIQVKADVVGVDLRESGLREILNYGHTLAHAIERVEGYSWRHGNAVAVGLVYAAALGRLTGRLGLDVAERHTRIIGALGLPVTYRPDAWEDLVTAMRVDKKTRGSTLRFVVLDALAKPGILVDPDPSLLKAAYKEIVT